MNTPQKQLPDTPAWQALSTHADAINSSHLRELFASDPGRFTRFSIQGEQLFLDYSKNRITEETRQLLLALAQESDLAAAIEAMFCGELLNFTEQRPVLHTALRNFSAQPVLVNGEDVMVDVLAVRQQMLGFCQRVWSGEWRGYTDRPITHIVNIGIGGSDLGPMMACDVLRHCTKPEMSVDFVSNVDACDMQEVLGRVELKSTLFIIASKTFTTQETMANAQLARAAMLTDGCHPSAIAQHFVAVTCNPEAAVAFGIDDQNTFTFWDWVGGRYSMWSSIGLAIALYTGMDNFEAMLKGAEAMDIHFRTTKFENNMPVMMALLGVWNTTLLGMGNHVIACYDQRLKHFPDHLQQLDMESNGKRVRRDGQIAHYATGPMLFGGTGTNSQHAYFQLLHQGTAIASVDFIACLQDQHANPTHHAMLLANCFAQSEAMMNGRDADTTRAELARTGIPEAQLEALLEHRCFPGNRPSNTLLFRTLSPETLGALVALYEHKVFVQGVIWAINSFDQWGVELGKNLTGVILDEFKQPQLAAQHDASTNALIDLYRRGDW